MAARTRKVEVEIVEDDPTELFEQAEVALLKRIVEAIDDDSNYAGDIAEWCSAYRSLVGNP